jgi:hypothetical protein
LNERTIWLVRIAGIAVILLLLLLLMSLHSRLTRLNQERQQNPRPQSSTGRVELPPAAAGTVWGANA